MATNDNGNWFSITEALEKLNISRRTLYDRINKDELTTKKEGRNRFIWLDVNILESSTLHKDKHTDGIVKQLQLQVSYLKDLVDRLELELKETRQRSDTIILKMADDHQLLLESINKKPFWKFW
ncbi:hypothetical protein CMK12_15865 [Candidatus Poribacteria bacterium]|jgi:predicted DNA-binding transcriptional regulator AlpA|nr:hypothetical protein [Candidatus Poribacteria bacterium]